MKALLLKDMYFLLKNMRFLLFLAVILPLFNNTFVNVYLVLYAAMFPYSTMAYDERCKWDQLAAMMPYSVRDIVVSKYALGWLCIAAMAALAVSVQGVMHLIFSGILPISPSSLLFSACSATCVLAVTLPLMFRFGVEKGRMIMLLTIGLVCGAATALASILDDTMMSSSSLRLLTVLLPAAAVVLTAVSIPLSIRMYRIRR